MAEELVMNVKSNIKGVTKDAQEMTEAVKGAKDETKGLAQETENVGDASEKSVSGVKKLTVGFKTLATATGFIFLLNKAFEAFQQILGKNQKVVDALDVAMESLSIAFNDLFKFIEGNVGKITGFFKSIFEDPTQTIKDFGNAIVDNLIERFNSLLDTFGHLGKAIGHLFEGEFSEAFNSVKDAGKESVDIWTGVDNSVDKVTTTMTNAAGAIKDYATETISSAKATIELNKASELAKVQVQGLIEEYDRQAEKLRQVRDDETKTFDERIKANNALGDVLKEQGIEMQKLVDIQVKAAQVEFDKNQSQENLLVLTEALNEKKAVEAQITGFQSEQLINQVSLEKELGEVQNEVLLARLEGIDLELAELARSYELQLQMAEKAGMDTAAITEQYEKEKSDIKERYQKESIKKERKKGLNELKWAEMNKDQKLDVATQAVDGLAQIAGEETEAGKALAVASATMNTYSAATAALAPPPVGAGPILGPVFAGVAIATGLSNIQKILSSGGGGGAAAGGANISAPPTSSEAPPAPQMMSGEFSLGGGVEPEPIKAFVVTDEMTSSQDQLANIRRRATI